jgi:hypothetical protein
VEFTMGKETEEQLRRLQDLLRREIPDGDEGEIFARALPLLLREVEKRKCAATSTPRPGRGTRPGSRHVPADVERKVWERDGGQCAFVAKNGHRCTERSYIELHHANKPYALGGEATVENMSLRCRLCRYRHSRHYAESRIMPCRTGRHPLPLDSVVVSANGRPIKSA